MLCSWVWNSRGHKRETSGKKKSNSKEDKRLVFLFTVKKTLQNAISTQTRGFDSRPYVFIGWDENFKSPFNYFQTISNIVEFTTQIRKPFLTELKYVMYSWRIMRLSWMRYPVEHKKNNLISLHAHVLFSIKYYGVDSNNLDIQHWIQNKCRGNNNLINCGTIMFDLLLCVPTKCFKHCSRSG